MPPKENITTDSAIHTEAQPFGAKPPSAVSSARPGAGASGSPKKTSTAPTRMNTKTAITVIEERKNSTTPKEPTLARLIAMITAAKSRLPAQKASARTQYTRSPSQATRTTPQTQTQTN